MISFKQLKYNHSHHTLVLTPFLIFAYKHADSFIRSRYKYLFDILKYMVHYIIELFTSYTTFSLKILLIDNSYNSVNEKYKIAVDTFCYL